MDKVEFTLTSNTSKIATLSSAVPKLLTQAAMHGLWQFGNIIFHQQNISKDGVPNTQYGILQGEGTRNQKHIRHNLRC